MVDFTLSDEQKQVRQLARDFAGQEMAALSASCDATGQFPTHLYQKAWEIGLMNVQIPEQLGGPGLSVFDSCLIAEELGAACTGINAAIEANNLAIAPLLVAGNSEQKKEFLEPLLHECAFAALCLNEAPVNYISASPAVARPDGNNYVIDGHKSFVTNAGVASWYCLLASSGERSGADTLFLVPARSEGISVGEKMELMGRRAADIRTVSFSGVTVPESCRLGLVGQGPAIIEEGLRQTQSLIAAAAVGLARQALGDSLVYARQRTTFGQAIAHHQAVGFLLADMAKEIEAARLLCWQSAWLADHFMDNGRQAAMAQIFSADAAVAAAVNAVQIFGGYGYCREYKVEKLMRDAKMFQILAGATHMEKVQIGRQLAGLC